MTVVVSDASPIHYLVLIGHGQVLRDLFVRVLIPPVVLAELSHERSPSLVRSWAGSLPEWCEVKQPTGGVRLPGLDPGEAEAIALAKEVQAEALLMDERQGRLIAKREGLTVYGTIGVLEAAAAEGLEHASFQTSVLLDAKATGKVMRTAIAGVLQKAAPGDTVVVQFSGHGSYVPDKDGDEPDGKDECFCPFDVMAKGPVTDDEIDALLAERRAGVKVVLIADSCHSGTVARFAPARNGGGRVRFLPPGVFLAEADARRLPRRSAGTPPGKYQALLLAGCQDREYCYDAVFGGRPNGAFTHAALQALTRLPPGVTFATWFAEIEKALPSQEYPQTPTGQDLVLIERVWAEHRVRIMAELFRKGVPRPRWPQSLHWDWSKKAGDIGRLAVFGIGVVYEREWQAVMMTKTQPDVARHEADRGKPIVYVDYVEAAPWNWAIEDLPELRPRFRGCGTLLLREAVAQSVREEFHERVGLHSLPQAERFYEHCGMTRFGPDRAKQNLTYFEFTRKQALRFLDGGSP